MGGITKIFSAPKTPLPPPPPPAPTVETVSQDPALTEERLRRQRAAGRQSNIVSNLSSSVEDTQAQTRISKLLG